jgi:hypothetical protein
MCPRRLSARKTLSFDDVDSGRVKLVFGQRRGAAAANSKLGLGLGHWSVPSVSDSHDRPGCPRNVPFSIRNGPKRPEAASR